MRQFRRARRERTGKANDLIVLDTPRRDNHHRRAQFALVLSETLFIQPASVEDNLIVAAAQRSNATYLITSDELLIKHAPVAALTPGDALTLLQAMR